MALARSLDPAAALPRAHAHSLAPPRSQQAAPPRPPRAPQHFTVGYGYYPDSHQRIPTLRLRGRWMEQLGFTIGEKRGQIHFRR
nr:SymE family type I addiction module toxin [Xanthomonas axonopodis]